MILIRSMVLIASLMVWSVVGLAVWLPLLVRSIAVFIVAILHAALTNEPSAHAAKLLEKAVSFYIDGFRRIIEAFQSTSSQPIRANVHLGRLVAEVAWALIFWFTTVGLALELRQSLARYVVPTTGSSGNTEAIVEVYVSQLKAFTQRNDVDGAMRALRTLQEHPSAAAVPAVTDALREFYRFADHGDSNLQFAQAAIAFIRDLKAKEACGVLAEVAVSSRKLTETASKASEVVCTTR